LCESGDSEAVGTGHGERFRLAQTHVSPESNLRRLFIYLAIEKVGAGSGTGIGPPENPMVSNRKSRGHIMLCTRAPSGSDDPRMHPEPGAIRRMRMGVMLISIRTD
jgi:hypothetical protein